MSGPADGDRGTTGRGPRPDESAARGSATAQAERRAASHFLEALRAPDPVRAVELRPPRAGLDADRSVDAWIEAHHGVRRLLDQDRFILYTDDAVGDREEESLRLLTSSFGTGSHLSQVVPFLTCKHTLEYCLLFARRAASYGLGAVTVTGGDTSVGPPRCLPRSRDLRAEIRERTPELAMGAWANPYRDAVEQVGFLMDPALQGDYFLTQIVSHHRMDAVDRFLEEAERRGLELPGMFGVFYFRSGRAETLERLSHFLPVPARELTEEFERGVPPEEVCARTVRALRERGVDNVYVCNLGDRWAAARLAAVEARL